jgi:anti-anti-sigma factor
MNKPAYAIENETPSPAASGILVLRLPEASDRQACEDFEAEVKGALASRPTMIVVDLSTAHSISTVILGMLLSLRRSMMNLGGEVRLTGVQPMVRRVLNICRLDQLFGVFANPESAMEPALAFSATPSAAAPGPDAVKRR